jgi:hypothetical protein
MARTLDTEPIVMSKLVRIASLRFATLALERRLNAGSLADADLEHLSELFAAAAKTNQMANAFIVDQAIYIPYFPRSYAKIKKFLNWDDEFTSNLPMMDTDASLSLPHPLIAVVTGFFERDLRFYLQAMQTNIYFASRYPQNTLEISNIQNQFEQVWRRNSYILSPLLLPILENATVKDTDGLAFLHSAQTALTIERFRQAQGKLPEKLDDLCPTYLAAIPTDPFDGKPLRYKRLARGYVVYSIGRDGEDNGGRERPPVIKSGDKTPYDLTFTVER